MKPVSPVMKGLEKQEIEYAKNQTEYRPLPALVLSTGMVLSRWEPTFGERLRLLFGGSVYLSVLTFNRPLQPVNLTTDVPEEFDPTRYSEY